MPRNGSGSYSLPAGNPVVTGTTISSTWANSTLSDIGSALTASIAVDGQTPPTANLPMGGFKHTNVAQATVGTEYARFDQVVPVGGGTYTGVVTFSSSVTFNAAATVNATLTIASTDPGAGLGPTLQLTRNSASPAANDVLAAINFGGNNVSLSAVTYGQIVAQILDATASSEDGRLLFGTTVAGAFAYRFEVGAGLTAVGQTDQGAGTVNATEFFRSGTVIPGGQAATQAEMEAVTATNRCATPQNMIFHPGIAKAWIVMNLSSGTPVPRVQFNTGSLTDNGAGDTTVSWTNAFSTADYAVVSSAGNATATGIVTTPNWTVAQTTTSVRVLAFISGGAATDAAYVSVVAYGDR